MKHLSRFLAASLVLVFIACSSSSPNPPKFRVKNDNAAEANLQVKTSNGNTININNVAAGTTSAYQSVAAGITEITAGVKGVAGTFTASFNAMTNQSFTIVVSNTSPPTVSVVSP